MQANTQKWIEADQAYAWHPFTDQAAWCHENFQPLILERGEGIWLFDSEGKKYLDANSSIWTNIHGHNHPQINQAIRDQLERVAHTSYLGFGNPRASELAEKLCAFFPDNTLRKVFFSDNGSTAVECAMKMALQYRMQTGDPQRTKFIAFANAYHGDTMGAASLGGVTRFFDRFRKFGIEVIFMKNVEELLAYSDDEKNIAAVIMEPGVQGVNQMHVWKYGEITQVRNWCDEQEVQLIFDEVMTGFGRTGRMFACQEEDVYPDFLCLAKGLTGGYMPLAATLTTARIYDAFLGEKNAFYYGHSYTANQLGCAAALASLEIFQRENVLDNVASRSEELHQWLTEIAEKSEGKISVRQKGLIAGIEIHDGRTGKEICTLLQAQGLLTRPILNTIVFMPPLCITSDELQHAFTMFESVFFVR